jgi:thymidylate synthase
LSLFNIVVFEEFGSGEKKIQGITAHAAGLEISRRINIEENLPELVDDPEHYIPEDFSADLVLDFLKHPDLSAYLAQVCRKKNIPVIASGKKHADAMTPFT